MKVCFVLPKYQRKPIGGYKIVYDYANRLVRDGHEVIIIYMNKEAFQKRAWMPRFLQRLIAEVLTQTGPRWYSLDKQVRQLSSMDPRLSMKTGDPDFVFATSAGTVPSAFKRFPGAKKCYMIQGYEVWGRITEKFLIKTYRTDSVKIVISEWLKKIVDQFSPSEAILIKNPIDTKTYREKIPINTRQNHSIGLLYHIDKIKGTKTALRVVAQLRMIYPDLSVKMFGAYPLETSVPDWIDYFQNASQAKTVEIYNQVQVFLCTSIKEGFGLTGYEAMSCGCALVSTDYQGVHEYAVDRENALLAPVEDVDALVQCVRELFDNPQERERLSCNGKSFVQQYSWEHAMEKLYNEVLKPCE